MHAAPASMHSSRGLDGEREGVPMTAQHAAGWTRRAFLGGVSVAGAAGLLGLYPRLGAAEPPPETTRLRLGRLPGICGAPLVVA